MYPVPHELEVALRAITDGLDLSDENKQTIHTRVVSLLMRQNRQLRQKTLRLANGMNRFAERAETFERRMGAYVGEEVALYINKALKKAVYVNTKARQQRLEAVDRFLEAFFKGEES